MKTCPLTIIEGIHRAGRLGLHSISAENFQVYAIMPSMPTTATIPYLFAFFGVPQGPPTEDHHPLGTGYILLAFDTSNLSLTY